MASVIRGDDNFDSGVVHDTLISSTTVTTAVASVEFTGFDASKYGSYVLVISNIIPSTTMQALRARTSSDGGTSWDSGASDYAYITGASKLAGVDRGWSGGASAIDLSYTGIDAASGNDGMSGTLNIYGPHLTKSTGTGGQLSGFTAGGLITVFNGGKRLSSADVDGIQLFFASGNIASGTFQFYGIAGV